MEMTGRAWVEKNGEGERILEVAVVTNSRKLSRKKALHLLLEKVEELQDADADMLDV